MMLSSPYNKDINAILGAKCKSIDGGFAFKSEIFRKRTCLFCINYGVKAQLPSHDSRMYSVHPHYYHTAYYVMKKCFT